MKVLRTLAELVRPEHTAVIVVDVEKGFTSEDSVLARRGTDTRHAREAVPRMNVLIEAAREAGVRVVYIQTVNNEVMTLANRIAFRGPVNQMPVQDFTWETEFDPILLPPREIDTVIKKYNYDAFSDTPLDLHLRSNGIHTCVFIGIETACCVETSARHAFIKGYNVVVAADGCGTCGSTYEESKEMHDASLRILAARFGWVATCEEIASIWAKMAR